MNFTLHPRLMADTDLLGELPLCQVLLSKEQVGPWIILVPKISDLKEIHHLPEHSQIELIKESSFVAQLLEEHFSPDKINVGALGNLVPQLHLHHIARFTSDIAWPGPIWGNTDGTKRSIEQQQQLIQQLQDLLTTNNDFSRN
ncbi:MAG: HIT family protein [Aliivibrio sp.]|uniref:HIT domain-containing protein n=1 Tax=Aliivibrio sp. TaxID=1872443 RepID=UPI001A5AED6E|nr:HIT family protein [Aliivibrio sp.]